MNFAEKYRYFEGRSTFKVLCNIGRESSTNRVAETLVYLISLFIYIIACMKNAHC